MHTQMPITFNPFLAIFSMAVHTMTREESPMSFYDEITIQSSNSFQSINILTKKKKKKKKNTKKT